MKAFFARFRRSAARPDAFGRRLDCLAIRVPSRLPAAGRSVFRMQA